MKPSERPPLKHKKGIQVIQPSHPPTSKASEWKDSATGSIQSTSRSRGISISRESGITIDKIYDAKHFLPPKSPQNQTSNAESGSSKTLTSVRSLKLISMFGDSNLEGSMQESKVRKEEVPPISEFKIEKGQMGSFQNRCNSPILKLANTQEPSEMAYTKFEARPRLNILKF